MIYGYVRWPSISLGEDLILHVSTDHPSFRVEIYRQGRELIHLGRLGKVCKGYHLPLGTPERDWGWPAYRFPIPGEWQSGAYVAMLIEIDAEGNEIVPDTATTFATSAKALFVLRHRGEISAGTILYKVSWATFAAYNSTGYGSLYTEALWSSDRAKPGFEVTWRRPGCGTGGDVMAGDPVDFYDAKSRRQTFEHWDAPFIAWLEREGYDVHFCCDWDIQVRPEILRDYSLLLSVGHDEYWSPEIRAAIEQHIDTGGNVAFLSGNIGYYRIHFSKDHTSFTCAKSADPKATERASARDCWFEADPECSVTGVSIALGGGWWDGKRESLGYTVQHRDHWIYAETGLEDGDVFGDDEGFPLLGYEVDGAIYRRSHGFAIVTGDYGTPRNFSILGLGELGKGWVTSRSGAAATMGTYTSPRGGIVFQGATTDWPVVVPLNPHVAQVTRNVLDRLRLRSCRILGPLPAHGGRMLAAVDERAHFHVDTADLGSPDELEFEWKISGVPGPFAQSPSVVFTLPADPTPVTVSVVVRRDGQSVAFGSETLFVLTQEEMACLDLLIDIRELVFPEDPNNSLASPARDPLDHVPMLYSNRLPWIRERAEKIALHAAQVQQIRSRPPNV
jgi:hypothetical protein